MLKLLPLGWLKIPQYPREMKRNSQKCNWIGLWFVMTATCILCVHCTYHPVSYSFMIRLVVSSF